MSDDINDSELQQIVNDVITNVVSIDEGRIKRMEEKGHYYLLLERFDVLRIRFIYDSLDKDEARDFVTLCKYFKKNGHSESLRLTCHYIFKKYMEKQGL
jgi:hypothetical protein